MNDINNNDTFEGAMVPSSPAPGWGGAMTPAPSVSFDQIMAGQGVMPNREVRTTYDLSTREGKIMKARHMAFNGDEGVKASWINREFQLVGCTSWPCRTVREDGEEVLFIRSVLETAQGDLIPVGSSYLYQSLIEIVNARGGISDEKPARVRIVKRGRTDQLEDVDLLEGTGHFAAPAPTGKKDKAKAAS